MSFCGIIPLVSTDGEFKEMALIVRIANLPHQLNGKMGMVQCKLNHLYKFPSVVSAISNRTYSNVIRNRGYEIVKMIAPL